MNYPFKKKSSLNRFLSLSLVMLMLVSLLGGCALLPGKTPASSEPDEPSSEQPTEIETPTEEPSTEAPTTKATEPPTEAPKENMAVVKEQQNIRSAPSSGSRVITQVDAGEELEVLRVEKVGTVNWAYVSSDSLNIMGWIVTDVLDMSNVTLSTGNTTTPANTEAATTPSDNDVPQPTIDNMTGTSQPISGDGKKGVVVASELNIRSSASNTGERVGSYKYGDRITVLESNNGWGRTDKGWVSLSYVYMDGDVGSNSVYGTVTASQLNVRTGPGTNYDRVKSLNLNDRVQIMEQVKIGNTAWGYTSGGWVSMEFIRVEGAASNNTPYIPNGTTTAPSSGTATITGSNVNVRAGAGTNFQIVGSLSYGDIVTVLETTTVGNSQWGRINNGWFCMDYARMN